MIWLDAHLSPALTTWLAVECEQPPAILWLTCGNTSNEALRVLLGATLPRALALIESGETLVEITDPA